MFELATLKCSASYTIHSYILRKNAIFIQKGVVLYVMGGAVFRLYKMLELWKK